MPIINLRRFYPFYETDTFAEVSDDTYLFLLEAERQEDAYRKRVTRNGAYYSLDCDDGIEREAVLTVPSPEEQCEKKWTNAQLHAALNGLPDKQAKRVYAHYFLGMSKSDIARSEDVDESLIRRSIRCALLQMETRLRKFLI